MINSKLLAIGLVLGGLVGVLSRTVMDNIPMGIVSGGGFGLVAGLAIGAALGRRTESLTRSIHGYSLNRADCAASATRAGTESASLTLRRTCGTIRLPPSVALVREAAWRFRGVASKYRLYNRSCPSGDVGQRAPGSPSMSEMVTSSLDLSATGGSLLEEAAVPLPGCDPFRTAGRYMARCSARESATAVHPLDW